MRRVVGHILLWTGFLRGAFLAVAHLERAEDPWSTIDWRAFGVALVVGWAGVICLRWKGTRSRRKEGKAGLSLEALHDRLATAARTVEGWLNTWDPRDVYDYCQRIEVSLGEPLLEFAAYRHELARAWGLAASAEVMSSFAEGERWLHRAWSASVDGFADEVVHSLGRATAAFFEAAERMKVHAGRTGW